MMSTGKLQVVKRARIGLRHAEEELHSLSAHLATLRVPVIKQMTHLSFGRGNIFEERRFGSVFVTGGHGAGRNWDQNLAQS